MEAVTGLLTARLTRLDSIISSPLTRSLQTAQIVAAGLGTVVDVNDLLAPGFDARRLWRLLRLYPGARRLLLVGHEPDFSLTIAAVIGGGQLAMKKGGLARVRLSQESTPRGSLLWLVTPGFLLPSSE
jgi:phosphohistidine phosphatase